MRERLKAWLESVGMVPVPCEGCGGSEIAGYATREMAMDGGDMSLEGSPVQCSCDGGIGGYQLCPEADELLALIQGEPVGWIAAENVERDDLDGCYLSKKPDRFFNTALYLGNESRDREVVELVAEWLAMRPDCGGADAPKEMWSAYDHASANISKNKDAILKGADDD